MRPIEQSKISIILFYSAAFSFSCAAPYAFFAMLKGILKAFGLNKTSTT